MRYWVVKRRPAEQKIYLVRGLNDVVRYGTIQEDKKNDISSTYPAPVLHRGYSRGLSLRRLASFVQVFTQATGTGIKENAACGGVGCIEVVEKQALGQSAQPSSVSSPWPGFPFIQYTIIVASHVQ